MVATAVNSPPPVICYVTSVKSQGSRLNHTVRTVVQRSREPQLEMAIWLMRNAGREVILSTRCYQLELSVVDQWTTLRRLVSRGRNGRGFTKICFTRDIYFV